MLKCYVCLGLFLFCHNALLILCLGLGTTELGMCSEMSWFGTCFGRR